MKNARLRTAMILGTVALVWSVPSLNIFGIVASIMSWAAYGKNLKSSASSAGALYIIAAAVSIAFALVLFYGGAMLSAVVSTFGEGEGNEIFSFMNGAAGFSIIGDILYIIAAVNSFKGGKELTQTNNASNGFFE